MEEFYKIEWNGVLFKYHKVGITEEGIPKWASKSLMDCNQVEDWKIKEVDFEEWLGYSTFSEDYAMKMNRFYSIDNFEEAKAESKRLWDEIIAPNALYKVAKYFDNIFDGWITEPMSKKLAKEKADGLNTGTRYLCSYEIKKVTNK